MILHMLSGWNSDLYAWKGKHLTEPSAEPHLSFLIKLEPVFCALRERVLIDQQRNIFGKHPINMATEALMNV